MVLSKVNTNKSSTIIIELSASQRRRIRRKRLQAAKTNHKTKDIENKNNNTNINNLVNNTDKSSREVIKVPHKKSCEIGDAAQNNQHTDILIPSNQDKDKSLDMSSNETQSKEDILAARQAKKLAKQKAKNKNVGPEDGKNNTPVKTVETEVKVDNAVKKDASPKQEVKKPIEGSPKSKDEVDKAVVQEEPIKMEAGDKTKEQIKAERAAKKAAKQAKKKGGAEEESAEKNEVKTVPKSKEIMPDDNMTVKDVVETLKDIVNVAKEVKEVTAKVEAIDLGAKKQQSEDSAGKSKAELRAERRAKQEAQRAAKQAATQEKAKPKPEPTAKAETAVVKEKSPKPKVVDKSKAKTQGAHRVNWFQHLYTEHDKEALKKIAINSNLHPAIIKLGVQLASRVVSGSNARCIALLDALKKMVRDYTLPAKTEFARGLESHLASSLDFLWTMRQPSASQTNAVKFFRHHLTQLPNNVDEFDAKKKLQEEIDRYIREQIDMAGEAISIAVRNKISNGDNILTYGCSSLIERILRDAWTAGVHFRTVVVGNRVHGAAREMLRRLSAHGLPCTYVDITAISYVMKTINKVLLGAGSLLVNGSVLGAVGTSQVALVARSFNVPVLVACETHKFSERVQTDAFVYNEIGNPDDLIDRSDDSSPLKDWRSNPNLTPLNLTYDVTPPSLVTAVVTELAILPCTSAPVVLRFKSEYGI